MNWRINLPIPIVLILLYFLHLTFSFRANADLNVDGASQAISNDQIKQIEKSLPRFNEDKVFYHWAKEPERAFRWIKQGALDQGEVDFYNKASADRQAHGTGIYVAESPTSSINFGDYGVAFEIKKETPIYDENVVQKILGRTLSPDEITELGKRIPFFRKVRDDWWVTNNAQNTQRIVSVAKYGASKEGYPTTLQLTNLIREMAQENPQAMGYMDSYVALSKYQDGISFIRSTTVNPKDPWWEFDSLNFESYKETRAKFYYKTLGDDDAFNVGRGGKLKPPDTKIEDWVESQVKLLKEIYLGSSGGTEKSWRSDEVVASRSEGSGQRFRNISATEPEKSFLYMSDDQVKALADNPYLEVFSMDVDGKPGLKHAAYRYKDVKAPLENSSDPIWEKMSSSFRKKLEQLDKSKLTGPEFATLNQEMIDDLVRQSLRKHANDPVGNTDLWRDLISIHPGSDFNGRSIRLYRDLAFAGAKKDPPFGVMTDLDIVIDRPIYDRIESSAIKGYQSWLASVIDEGVQARNHGRMPKFHDVSFVKHLETSMKDSPLATVFSNLDAEDLKTIGARDFELLLRKKLGPAWEWAIKFNLNDLLDGNPELLSAYKTSSSVRDIANKSVDDFLKRVTSNEYHSHVQLNRHKFSTEVSDLLYDRLAQLKGILNSEQGDYVIIKLAKNAEGKVDLTKAKALLPRDRFLLNTFIMYPNELFNHTSKDEFEDILKNVFIHDSNPNLRKTLTNSLYKLNADSPHGKIISEVKNAKLFNILAHEFEAPFSFIVQQYENVGDAKVLTSGIRNRIPTASVLYELQASKRFAMDPERGNVLIALLKKYKPNAAFYRFGYEKDIVFDRIIEEIRSTNSIDKGEAVIRSLIRTGNVDIKQTFNPSNRSAEEDLKIIRHELKTRSSRMFNKEYYYHLLQNVPKNSDGNKFLETHFREKIEYQIAKGSFIDANNIIDDLARVESISDSTANFLRGLQEKYPKEINLYPVFRVMATGSQPLTGEKLKLAQSILDKTPEIFNKVSTRTFIEMATSITKIEGLSIESKNSYLKLLLSKIESSDERALAGISAQTYRDLYDLLQPSGEHASLVKKVTGFKKANLDKLIIANENVDISDIYHFNSEVTENLISAFQKNPEIRNRHKDMALKLDTDQIKAHASRNAEALKVYRSMLPRSQAELTWGKRTISWLNGDFSGPITTEAKISLNAVVYKILSQDERPSKATISEIVSIANKEEVNLLYANNLYNKPDAWQYEFLKDLAKNGKGWNNSYHVANHLSKKVDWNTNDREVAKFYLARWGDTTSLRSDIKHRLRLDDVLRREGVSLSEKDSTQKVKELVYQGKIKGMEFKSLPGELRQNVVNQISNELSTLEPTEKRAVAKLVGNGLDLQQTVWRNTFLGNLKKELSLKQKYDLRDKKESKISRCIDSVFEFFGL